MKHASDYAKENNLVKEDTALKAQLQAQIDSEIEASFPVYKCYINRYLKALGAHFRIGTFRKMSDRSSVLFVDFNVAVSGMKFLLETKEPRCLVVHLGMYSAKATNERWHWRFFLRNLSCCQI